MVVFQSCPPAILCDSVKNTHKGQEALLGSISYIVLHANQHHGNNPWVGSRNSISRVTFSALCWTVSVLFDNVFLIGGLDQHCISLCQMCGSHCTELFWHSLDFASEWPHTLQTKRCAALTTPEAVWMYSSSPVNITWEVLYWARTFVFGSGKTLSCRLLQCNLHPRVMTNL